MSFDSPPPEADAEAWVRRVHTVLRRVFRRAGRGSIRRVEEALEIFDGSFRQWRQRGQLQLDVLFRALRELGVDPARFWVEVFGGDFDPVELAKRPAAPPRDPVVRRAVARWHGPAPDDSTGMTDERWRRLDALRGEDPGLAVRRSKAVLERAEPRWIPRLLAAYGSARRAQARLDQALEALHYALLLAEGHDGRAVCADLLQRLGVAYGYTGDHTLGLLFAKEAAYEHRMAGDLRGEGRSWVDQGSRYASLDRFDDAVAANQAALRCLPEDEVRHRFSAYHCLASIHLRQGRLRQAAACLGRAEELAPRIGEDLVGGLQTVKATLAAVAGDHARAERAFAAATEVFRKVSPLDAALASVDLARSQVLCGRMDRALGTVKGMAAFLEPLKKNALASEAILQLVRVALAGQGLTLRLLNRARRALEKGRARP
ncbi:MAG: hypothetical protein GY719_27510 [bacterium]|nr:hypothetical protein [bacterium]